MALLTKERLKEIAERAHNAWPGPWLFHGSPPVKIQADPPDASGYTGTPQDKVIVRLPDQYPFGNQADYAFIAHSREDVPDLAEAVEMCREFLVEALASGKWEPSRRDMLEYAMGVKK